MIYLFIYLIKVRCITKMIWILFYEVQILQDILYVVKWLNIQIWINSIVVREICVK